MPTRKLSGPKPPNGVSHVSDDARFFRKASTFGDFGATIPHPYTPTLFDNVASFEIVRTYYVRDSFDSFHPPRKNVNHIIHVLDLAFNQQVWLSYQS